MSLTYKEIKDQYARLAKTKDYLDSEMAMIGKAYEKHSFVVYIGCGSSYSLAKSLATGTMTILGTKAMAVPAGDILLRPDTYKNLFQDALIVAISRSGTTSEILMACDALTEVGCNYELLSFSCTTGKALAEKSDYPLELPWTFDESVCQTSAVTNLYFAGEYLLSVLAKNEEIRDGLVKLIDVGDQFISQNEESFKRIAKLDWNSGVTLADAEISGICEEGSLTFKEICQLPSNHYPVLDVRHGPVVVFNEQSLVIMAVNDVTSALEIDLINDLKEKKCTLLTVSDLPLEIEGTTNFCLGESIVYTALGVLFLNVAQMITYYKAVELNVNPDEPNGLDPWISLE